jgi:RNA polymerase sigma-70 factor (ECF subfamily)
MAVCVVSAEDRLTPRAAAEDAGGIAALVAAARAGDREAFAELYRRYAGMVNGILLARLGPQDAPDVLQEVFLRALSRLGDLRRPEAFGGWLAALARTAAADHRRRPPGRLREVELPEDLVAATGPGAEAQAALAAIRSLPSAYAETLAMRLVEGMTGPEIAERTGRRPGSVRVNLHRGMKLLRRALDGGRR